MIIKEEKREYFIDILRFLIVILVVFHHAGQAYGPTGGEWPVSDGPQINILGRIFAVNASFFMGLLFLISGNVIELAYNKYGPEKVIKNKFQHIFIPMLVVMWGILLPVSFVFSKYESFGLYMEFIFTAQGIRSITGHLWFLQHLLVYSLLFVIFKKIFKDVKSFKLSKSIRPFYFHLSIILLITVLSIITYFVRIEYPIDRWVVVGNIISAEVAHFPQYIMFFIVGVITRKLDIFNKIDFKHGIIYAPIAISIVIFLIIGRMFPSIGNYFPFDTGGATNAARNFAVAESLLAVSMSITLLFLLKQFLNFTNAFIKFHSDNSYGLYLIHVFPQVGLQMVMVDSGIPTVLKLFISTIVTVYIGYLLIALLRKIPGINLRKYL